MKKCMNCGYENPDNASVCVVCNDALTKGIHVEGENDQKIFDDVCLRCKYPLLKQLIYSNCPHCSFVFGEESEGEKTPLKQNFDIYENIKIKIILNSSLLAEIQIEKDQIIFNNPKDYQHKKLLQISELKNDSTKILRHSKIYGKRKSEDIYSVEVNDFVELFSKEDNMLIEINFK